MKDLLDPILSKKLGVAMTAVISLAYAAPTDLNLIAAVTVIACTHTICQTIIDMKQGRAKEVTE